jgi:hypothetical protein
MRTMIGAGTCCLVLLLSAVTTAGADEMSALYPPPALSQDVGPQPVTFFFVVAPRRSDGSLVFPGEH